MALLLSTVDGGKITGMQARAFHQSSSQSRDVIFKNYGQAFATASPVGFTAVVGTGMLVGDGVICENTEPISVSMPAPAKNGNGLLLAVIDAGKKTFSFEMQPHANSILKNDLVATPNGIRKIPLYFFQYTTSAIVAWTDWRQFGEVSDTPAGTIVQFAGSVVPSGWLLCDGSLQYQVRYPDLFAAIGTLYNKPGTSVGAFNVPDFKGRVPVGFDVGDQEFSVLGKTGGAKKHTLTVNEIPPHNHDFDGQTFLWGDNKGNVNIAGTSAVPGSSATGNKLYTNNGTSGWADTFSTGGGNGHNNLQPYITVNFIIKY